MDKINSLIPKNNPLINIDKIKSKNGLDFDHLFEIAFNKAMMEIVGDKNILDIVAKNNINNVLISKISTLVLANNEKILKKSEKDKKDDEEDQKDSSFEIVDGFLMVNQSYINAQVYAIIKEEMDRKKASQQYEKNSKFKYLEDQNRGDGDGGFDGSNVDIKV